MVENVKNNFSNFKFLENVFKEVGNKRKNPAYNVVQNQIKSIHNKIFRVPLYINFWIYFV